MNSLYYNYVVITYVRISQLVRICAINYVLRV